MLPVERLVGNAGAKGIGVAGAGVLLPDLAAVDLARIGIEQDPLRIEKQPLAHVEDTVKTIAVLEILVTQVKHDHRPDVAETVLGREGNLRIGLGRTLFKKHQRAGLRVG